MKKRVELKIYGQVQGVFFRDSGQRKAKELNLFGWVRNDLDGTVQIVAEGEEKDLKELIAWCRAGGPEYAKVDRVKIEWSEPDNRFNEFMLK